jgi:hypothetical protein
MNQCDCVPKGNPTVIGACACPIHGLMAMRELVDQLTEGDRENPCRFDHHGYCQEHGWLETNPSCPWGRAAELFH